MVQETLMTDKERAEKQCETCGHPKSWHGNRCWGDPKRKRACGDRCMKFKPRPRHTS